MTRERCEEFNQRAVTELEGIRLKGKTWNEKKGSNGTVLFFNKRIKTNAGHIEFFEKFV